jgi:F0F1-type ATP synthase delta subunit
VTDRDVLVHGYAEALFSVAEAEGALGSIENELFAFAKR